jgi:hypothetical protein
VSKPSGYIQDRYYAFLPDLMVAFPKEKPLTHSCEWHQAVDEIILFPAG